MRVEVNVNRLLLFGLLGLWSCDLKVPFGDTGSGAMCLDEFLEMMATDRELIESAAAELLSDRKTMLES